MPLTKIYIICTRDNLQQKKLGIPALVWNFSVLICLKLLKQQIQVVHIKTLPSTSLIQASLMNVWLHPPVACKLLPVEIQVQVFFLLFHVFQDAAGNILQKGNKTHDTSETTSLNILFLNKIVLKCCSIILPSPDK